jgi:hypothetical protein
MGSCTDASTKLYLAFCPRSQKMAASVLADFVCSSPMLCTGAHPHIQYDGHAGDCRDLHNPMTFKFNCDCS